MGDTARFKRIQRFGLAGGYVAKRTAPRANFAHDHHRGVALAPAFAHVGAARLFAHCHQFFVAQDVAGLFVAFGGGGFHPDPIRLFGLRIVLAMRFFGVALFGQGQIAGHRTLLKTAADITFGGVKEKLF